MAYPDETLPVIWEGVKGVWNDKIVNGSAEDRANIAGQAVFEVATWLVGVGEAKAGSSVAKAADKTADIAKATDKISDASKVLDKATDLARYKTGLQALGKDIVKGLDDQALAAGKKFGNAVDQMRYSMNQLTRNTQPQFAGIGSLDEMGSTADKIEDLYKTVKKSSKKQDAVGCSPENMYGIGEYEIADGKKIYNWNCDISFAYNPNEGDVFTEFEKVDQQAYRIFRS